MPGGVQGPASSAQPGSFGRLRQALGLEQGAAQGDRVELAPQGLDPIVGLIDYLRPSFIGIRTADGLYRFFGRDAFGSPVGVALHLFSAGADAEATKLAWQDWLSRALA